MVYAALLVESPTTAYRIAKNIGRQVANTYQAVASLRQRGAVVVEDGKRMLCRAVPTDEVLAAMHSRFLAHRDQARAALASLARDDEDDRVYRLATPQQVFERARALLRGRPRFVLADLFPGVLSELRSDLAAVARRGARVAIKAYSKERIPGVEIVRGKDAPRVLSAWPGEQLSLVVDAKAHLLALLAKDLDVVLQAVASASTFLSCMHHNHLANEIRLTAADNPKAGAARRNVASLALLAAEPPGLRSLCARFPRSRSGTRP